MDDIAKEPTKLTIEEVTELIRRAEIHLAPHRQWGECPMTGEEDCCDVYVRELACLHRIRATLEALTAERATAIEAMIKTLHESSSDYEAALESCRSENAELRETNEVLEAEVYATSDALGEGPYSSISLHAKALVAESEALRRDRDELRETMSAFREKATWWEAECRDTNRALILWHCPTHGLVGPMA